MQLENNTGGDASSVIARHSGIRPSRLLPPLIIVMMFFVLVVVVDWHYEASLLGVVVVVVDKQCALVNNLLNNILSSTNNIQMGNGRRLLLWLLSRIWFLGPRSFTCWLLLRVINILAGENMKEALDLIPFWSTVDRESPEQIKRICTYVVDGRTLPRQVWESCVST